MPDRKPDGFYSEGRPLVLKGPAFELHMGAWKPKIRLRGILAMYFDQLEVWRGYQRYHFHWHWRFPDVRSDRHELISLTNRCEFAGECCEKMQHWRDLVDMVIYRPIATALRHELDEGLFVDGSPLNDPHPERLETSMVDVML